MQCEDDELDAFVDVVDLEEHAWVGAVASEGQYGGGDLEDAEIEDDHGEDGAEKPRGADNEMESRVQDKRLSSDHPPPSKGGEGSVDVPGTSADEPFEDNADGVGNDTPGGDEKGPKVNCVVALECSEDFEVDEERHVNGEGKHGDEDGGACCVFRKGPPDDTAITSRLKVHDALRPESD